jgi:hypothetical protein
MRAYLFGHIGTSHSHKSGFSKSAFLFVKNSKINGEAESRKVEAKLNSK